MPDEIALATIRNVPLARVGPARLWKGGERNFTEDELRDAVRAASDPEIGSPRVKLAHEHQYDTGEPSFGSYEGLRYDDATKTVYGDIKGVPLWLAKVLPTFYPRRSFEASENVETSGGAYKLAFRAIGSLGIKMPAIKGLADLAHWATKDMPDGVVLEAAEGTADPAWPDTAIEPELETSRGDTTVDIREKLGLPKEATDEQVAAKLDELTALATAGSPEALAAVREAAITEAQEAAAAAAAEAEAERVRQAAAAGLVTVEAAALAELQANAARGAEARDEQDKTRRSALIDRKIGAGAIAPASRDKLLATLEAGGIDEATIEGLPEGVLPIDKKLIGKADTADIEAGDESDDSWMQGLLTADEYAAVKGA